MFSIRKAEAFVVRIPLVKDRVTSEEFGEKWTPVPRLILRLEDDEGFEGWGEAVLPGGLDIESALRRFLRDSSATSFLSFPRRFWSGEHWLQPPAPSPYQPVVPDLIHRLRTPLQVMFESALFDLLGRRAGVPICFLLGGPWRDQIPVHFWMSRVTPEKAAEAVRYGRELGFRGVKLKAALNDPNVERLEAIRDAVGVDWPVTVDPNGRFNRYDDALRQVLDMDAVGNLDILEDPFPRHFLQDFVALRSRIRARMVVHIDPPETIGTVIASGAAGGLNLDVAACGIFGWLEQAAAAASANLPVWHGSGLDLGIATALQLHLMASARNAQLAGDQIGPWLMETSLLRKPLTVHEGLVPVPTGPGLGIDIDLDELDRRTQQRVVVESPGR